MTHTDERPPIPDVEEPPWEPPEDPGPPARPRNGHHHTPANPLDRTPPCDRSAEQLVLGASLLHPKAHDATTRILTTDDFYWPHHQLIWRTITTLSAAGHPTNSTAVLAQLTDTGQLRLLGDPTYLIELEQAAHNAGAHIDPDFYAHRVDDLARRRRAIEHLTRGLQRLTNPGPDTDVDQVLNDAATELTTARDNLANPATPTTWTPVDLAPVLAGEHLDPPPTMLRRTDGIPLLYDGAVHTVSGESESGKTWLTLLAALQLFREERSVVFVDFEDRADRVVARLLALGATPTQIRTHFAYVRPDRPLDDDGRAQLAPALTGRSLCILDGVTEAMTTHGLDLNSNADSATFQALLPRWIADHGPAVVLIDHVVKDKEKQDRFALGAQHKLAGIDGAAYIVKTIQPFSRGRRGLAQIQIAKDRPGHVREQAYGKTIAEFSLDASISDTVISADLNPPGADSGRPGQPFEPTVLMERISRYVQANPGLSQKTILGTVNGKTDVKRAALELLVIRGHIGTKAGARGAIQHFHQEPYYQPSDGDSDTAQEDS